MRNNRFAYLIIVPTMAFLTLFVIVPIVGSFVIALFDYNPLRADNIFLGSGNYARLLGDTQFLGAAKNTVVFVLVTVSLNLIITLLVAQLMSNVSRKWMRNLFMVCIFLPCVAPLANSAVVWGKSMFPTKDGLINRLLGLAGVAPLNWTGSADNLMLSLIILTLWADIGYNTVLFTAGMDGIPRDFYEAAEIDGANALHKFFRLTLPLLGRTFSFVCAMTLISHFQAFVQFSVLAPNGGAGKAGEVLTTYIYYTGFKVKDMGYASAVSVALFCIIMLVTLVQQRLNRVDWGY